jgi:CRP-like cAMP-binding protein
MSVFAVTATSAAYVPLPTLEAVLSARPEWWKHIGQLSVAIGDIVGNCFADLMIRDSSQRCAAILLRLCDCRFQDSASEISREIVLKQNEFAAMANLSRDTVNTILQQFSSKGLVELRYGSIVVAKTKPLRKLANGD